MRHTVFLIALLCAGVTAGGSTDPLTFVGSQRTKYIDFVGDLAVSPDGSKVYAAGTRSDAISVFNRNTTSGELSWRGAVRATDLSPLILEGPAAVAVSPDGGHIYVAALNGVSVFENYYGDLTFLEVYRDGEGGLTTLASPHDLLVSPDNKHVYVAASGDSSLTVFSRDRTTGLLTYLEAHTDGADGVDGLDVAYRLAISADGRSVYVTSVMESSVAVFDRDLVTGKLTFSDVYKDSYVGIYGLGGAQDVMVSSDGANVYVSGTWDHAIAVFERNPVNGLLTFVEAVMDEIGGVTHLELVDRLAGSADGKHLYATSSSDRAVTVFDRSPTNGALTQLGVEAQDTPISVVLPDDGSSVLVGDAFEGITAFARNPSTGLLHHVDSEYAAPGLDGASGITAAHNPCVHVAGNRANRVQFLTSSAPGGPLVPTSDVDVGHFDFGLSGVRAVATSRTENHIYVAGYDTDEILAVAFDTDIPCRVVPWWAWQYGNGSDGVLGLDGPQHLTLSPDERHLYVASSIADTVVLFVRDSDTGELTYYMTWGDGVGGVDGLDGAYWVEVSPDGTHVYVAGYVDDAIAVFYRDPFSGWLTQYSIVRNDVGGVEGLDGVSSLAISPDGKHLYAAGRNDDAVAIFGRTGPGGSLSYLGRVTDGVGGVDGLNGARAVAVSPDGRQVYVASQYDDALAVFSRDSVNGLLAYVGMHKDGVGGVDGLDTANGVAVSLDGMQVYVTGYSDNAVATFYRSDVIIFADGFESGGTTEWSSVVGGP